MLNKIIFTVAMLVIAWHSHSQEAATEKPQGASPVITLTVKDASLKEVTGQMEKQMPYTFIYNETIDLNQKKSVDIRNQKPESALNHVFDRTNIEWEIKGNHIILNRKKQAASPAVRKVTVSGYITDTESSEVLIGASVYDRASGTGTSSNEFGFFSLTLPAGDAELRFSYIGYDTEIRSMSLQKDEKVNIKLTTNLVLQEVVITGAGKQESGVKATRMSALDVPLRILKSTPSLLGETDVMKTIQMLPGVQSSVQGSAGVHVRGGGPDENLILLDGIPLYNVDHLFGLFSVFTPEAVKKVTLFKGSFPARFGGRLSSVIDVRTNDGDMYNYHGAVSIGLLSSKLQVEGPVWKGRTSFNVSARRSYLDLIAKPFFKEDKGTLFFYDLNAKINHIIDDRNRLFISLYNGMDKFGAEIHDDYKGDDKDYAYEDKGHLNWGNTLVAARWNHVFSPKLFSNATVALTNYRFNIKTDSYSVDKKEDTESFTSARYNSGIRDWAGKMDFDYYPLPGHHVKFGANYLYHNFKPEVENTRVRETENGVVSDSTYSSLSNSHIFVNDFSVYAEDELNVTPRLSVNAGLHFSLFNVRNTSYASLQPRLSARYLLSDDFAMKASYTKMNQCIHLLSAYNITLPLDLWVPATDRIKPMHSNQYSLGAYHTGVDGWEFSAEAYYKDMRNILEYKDGATFLGSSHGWEEKVEAGRGRSYGIELMAQKTAGKTTGWIAYTLAKSERKFDKMGINLGRWFPYKYDRRHHVNLAVNHKISERIDLSASWEFYTGGVFTVSEEMTSIIFPHYQTYYGGYYGGYGNSLNTGPVVSTGNYIAGRNNYRLPASHCLNLGINFRKQKKHGERIWNFGIFNAYNAMNPHFVYKTTVYDNIEYKEKPVLKKITVLPFIPSFTYTYKF